MRLFLHMPKCAGSSIKKLLEDSAPDDLQFDYESYFGFPYKERSQKIIDALFDPVRVANDKIVYGHFFPVKYIGNAPITDLTLVTIIRDPLDRLLSHYKFWNSGEFSGHYIWRKMKREKWDFERFALSDDMKNFYAQYLCQVPLSHFSYIGLYENLEESLRNIFQNIGISEDISNKIPHYNKSPGLADLDLGQNLKQKIRDFHAEDYIIYGYALKKWHRNWSGRT